MKEFIALFITLTLVVGSGLAWAGGEKADRTA